jgi:preprotein translocase subunit SecA
MSTKFAHLAREAASMGLSLDPVDLTAIAAIIAQTRRDLYARVGLPETLTLTLPDYLDEEGESRE